ncbi:hypothetical protein AAZV13_01G101600 [Glycine max]
MFAPLFVLFSMSGICCWSLNSMDTKALTISLHSHHTSSPKPFPIPKFFSQPFPLI